MANWSGFSIFLNRSINITAVFFLLSVPVHAQQFSRTDLSSSLNYQPNFAVTSPDTIDPNPSAPSLPEPKSVLYKSLMIPGWGQIINKQIWKVPIVYGLLGGLTYYSIYLTKRYHDYRAAYYNQAPDIKGDDQRYGSTPAYLDGVNPSSLKNSRDYLHNRRDFIYITIALAYGLNAIDAYVFAHLRSFDVSEDLSMRPSIKPGVLADSTPGITLSLELFKSNK